MTNIAPQHHRGFNGAGGLWYKLERFVQRDLFEPKGSYIDSIAYMMDLESCLDEVWVYAGCIVGPGEVEYTGRNEDIAVPAMFWKIVIWEEEIWTEEGVVVGPKVLAFLFPHQRISHGEIQSFLVSIDVVEQLTGLDFQWGLDVSEEDWIEAQDTWENWRW